MAQVIGEKTPNDNCTQVIGIINKIKVIKEWTTLFLVWSGSTGRFVTKQYVNGHIFTTDNDKNYEDAIDSAYKKTISRVYQCCKQIELGIPAPGP